MAENLWVDVGPVNELTQKPVLQVMLGRTEIAMIYQDGQFGASNGSCNHVGEPLGEGYFSAILRMKHLDGHVASQFYVCGEIDGSHASTGNLPFHLILF